jgi:hypothetical protein
MNFKNSFILALAILYLFIAENSSAQRSNGSAGNACWGDWQVSVNLGTQMSGIKDEDFVSGNIAPLLKVSVAKWFSPVLALQIGYQGWYFHQIIDDNKYPYGYYFGEAVVNVNGFCKNYTESSLWSLHLHGGAGYFYNYTYNRPNVCADMGVSNNFRISRHFRASIDVAAIVGWDIYQGDEDILPGVTLGIAYLF